MNPHQSSTYSGPSVLASRLFDQTPNKARVVIVGPAKTANRSSRAEWEYVSLRSPSVQTRIGQMMWSVRSSIWIVKNASDHDLLHFHGAYLYALLPALFARFMRVPYVLFPLSAGGDLSIKSGGDHPRLVQAARKHLVSAAAGAFALAPQIVDELEYWGLARSSVLEIANPAPDAFFEGPVFDHRANGRVICFIGKLGHRKAPDLVLRTLHNLREEWPQATAVFVGPYESREFENYFVSLAEGLGVADAITVTGHVADVRRWISPEVSVLLLPSMQEGLPGALAEAMALGIPVGVSEAGAMPRVIAESGGGRALPRKAEAMADFVSEIWRDSNVWQTLAKLGREYAEDRFSTRSVRSAYWEGLSRWV